jgi:hypothetical protein
VDASLPGTEKFLTGAPPAGLLVPVPAPPAIGEAGRHAGDRRCSAACRPAVPRTRRGDGRARHLRSARPVGGRGARRRRGSACRSVPGTAGPGSEGPAAGRSSHYPSSRPSARGRGWAAPPRCGTPPVADGEPFSARLETHDRPGGSGWVAHGGRQVGLAAVWASVRRAGRGGPPRGRSGAGGVWIRAHAGRAVPRHRRGRGRPTADGRSGSAAPRRPQGGGVARWLERRSR